MGKVRRGWAGERERCREREGRSGIGEDRKIKKGKEEEEEIKPGTEMSGRLWQW